MRIEAFPNVCLDSPILLRNTPISNIYPLIFNFPAKKKMSENRTFFKEFPND